MGITPFEHGATLPVWEVTVQDDTGVAINLTGATISLVIVNTLTGVQLTGAGSWTITNAAAGQATYYWAAADTAVPGSYKLLVSITLAPGSILKPDPVSWQVV